MDLSAQRKRHRRRRIEVNIVPLVDVMMTLIFFFLITMQFKQISSVDITPPAMASSEKSSAEKSHVIGITKAGDYIFNSAKINFSDLERELKKLAESEKSPTVILLADKDVPLHFATSAIDAVRTAKIRKLSIQSGSPDKR